MIITLYEALAPFLLAWAKAPSTLIFSMSNGGGFQVHPTVVWHATVSFHFLWISVTNYRTDPAIAVGVSCLSPAFTAFRTIHHFHNKIRILLHSISGIFRIFATISYVQILIYGSVVGSLAFSAQRIWAIIFFSITFVLSDTPCHLHLGFAVQMINYRVVT